jgi:pilus assembly protein CpaF
MCSVHANSARDAVTKMCTLPLLAGENVSHRFVVPTVASSVDLVAHISNTHDGRRIVTEVVALPGRVEGDVVETADVFATRGGRLVRADGWPPHQERFERAGIDLHRLLSEPFAAIDGFPQPAPGTGSPRPAVDHTREAG